MVSILKNVKKLAKERNISLTNLELKAGLGNGTIGKWDDIKGLPNMSTLKAVADALEVPLTDLLDEKGE